MILKIICCLFFALFGGWMLRMGILMLFAEKNPKWGLSVNEYNKQAEAIVTGLEIRRGHHYAFRYAKYKYTVNGTEYTGEDSISYYDKYWQVGRKFIVYYNESNPSDACMDIQYLKATRNTYGVIFTLFGAFFLLASIVIIIGPYLGFLYYRMMRAYFSYAYD